jgi:glycosyltransferase involved in cell wall biosynthesis
MKVSIIIPCFNQGEFLHRLLSSINNQTYKDIEIIIIDDGSPSPIFVNKTLYCFRIKLYRTENRGLSKARNYGIQRSEGELIKFVDADDELLPNCILSQVKSISKCKNSFSVIGFREYWNSEKYYDIYPTFGCVASSLTLVNMGPPHIYLFHRSVVQDLDGFKSNRTVEGGHEDYDFILRVVSKGVHAVSVNDIGVIYHKRNGSMATNHEKMKRTQILVWMNNILDISQIIKDHSNFIINYAYQVEYLNNRNNGIYLSLLNEINRNVYDVIKDKSISISRYGNKMLGKFKEDCKTNIDYFLSKLKIFEVPEVGFIHNQEYVNWKTYFILKEKGKIYEKSRTYIKEKIKLLLEYKEEPGVKAIYGCGYYGKEIYSFLKIFGININYFIDKNKNIVKHDGIEILQPDDLQNISIKIIVIASLDHEFEIRGDLNKLINDKIILI